MTRSAVVTLVTLVAIAGLVACSPAPRLSGTELPAKDAPDFTLADGLTGQTVTLASLRGNVVVLSFLYTRCPDVCPITAALFRSAQKTMGLDAPVRYVAVSVDPEGDTPAQVRAFSDAHDLGAGWHYLVGPRAQLQAVWASYGVGSFPDPSGLGVAHNDAIFVIDRKGRERELIHSDVRLGDLVADLRTLASEK
jgi:protein SCO1/2